MATTQAIWKDAVAILPGTLAVHGVPFRIETGGNIIYQGRAYLRPGGGNNPRVRINDICADFLQNNYPPEAADYDHLTFDVKAEISPGTWVGSGTFTLYRDWSYDPSRVPGTDIPVDPLLDIVHPGQYLPIYSDNGTFNYSYTESDGSAHSGYLSHAGNWYFKILTSIPDLATITANGHTYRVADLCGGYVFYYINAYGGWDSLVVQGRTARGGDITRYDKEVVYDNAQAYARGRFTYVNDIVERYRCSVGPMNSAQSHKIGHLLCSPFVYLHDIDSGLVRPVTLKATAYDIEDQRGRLHYYDVEATLAQQRLRR